MSNYLTKEYIYQGYFFHLFVQHSNQITVFISEIVITPFSLSNFFLDTQRSRLIRNQILGEKVLALSTTNKVEKQTTIFLSGNLARANKSNEILNILIHHICKTNFIFSAMLYNAAYYSQIWKQIKSFSPRLNEGSYLNG